MSAALCTSSAFYGRASDEVGYREGPNNDTKYGRWYAAVFDDAYFANAPYCAMGLSWCGHQESGRDSLLGYFASCSAWIAMFKKAGRWSSTPHVGDLVFYTYSHVELVTKVSTHYIYTIGFNTSSGEAGSQRNGDGVYRRTRARNSTIRGYGRPNYQASVAPAPRPKPSTSQTTKGWQALLAFAPSRRDGLWGPATDQRSQWLRTAAKYKNGSLSGSATSTIKLIQRVIGTPDDGDWGPASRAAMTRWIKRAQKFLGVTADGDWGPKTEAAYQKLRKANRL